MYKEENQLSGRVFRKETVRKDIVVVGAGIAGITAALTAARQGMRVALVTDRPVLGGSASSEIRVGPGGADSPAWNRYARETGIMEEIFNHIQYRASFSGKWRWFYFDQVYFDMVLSEPNIACFLNTSICKVTRDDNLVINSVEGIQLRSEKCIEFQAEQFIDCSGDGTVGYLAGADYRMGREAKEEYDEPLTPEQADKGTMGASLLFTSVDTGHPVQYIAPKWAIDVTKLGSFGRINRSIGKMPDGTFYGFWWVEYGGQIDSIHDDDKVIWELRKLVMGIWDHIKNSGLFKDVANLEMNWIGYLPGKRESRRLMGPYITSSVDFLAQKSFPDSIGHCGWAIDIHPPEGYLSTEPGVGCRHSYLPGISDIPLRCVYSRNISNLLFAGRNISTTHEGLGTLRLISTTSVMGQAAGMAAAMCIEKGAAPHEIYMHHLDEIKRRLARSDQSIIGYRLLEDNDLSRTAHVTVSSERRFELTEPDAFRILELPQGIILPISDRLDVLSLYMKANTPTLVTADLYTSDDKPQNYRAHTKLKTITVECFDESWYNFKFDMPVNEGKKFFVLLHKNPEVRLFVAHKSITGALGFTLVEDVNEMKWDTVYRAMGENTSNVLCPAVPCFRASPDQSLYSGQNLNNGYIRPYGLPHLWASAEMQPGRAEWAEYSFDREQMISSVEIVFNSELNHPRLQPTISKVWPELVRSYALYAITDAGEIELARESENFLRYKTHSFTSIKAKALKIMIYETWGSKHAEVFDVRIY